MRIGIFSESYEPVRNGVATSVKTLVEELRERRHHVCIVAPEHPEQHDDSPFILRVPSILTPMNVDYPVPYPRRCPGATRRRFAHVGRFRRTRPCFSTWAGWRKRRTRR